ncbi:hypothetical protein TrLO_g11616 [Triparma laevis f. longispina]|uniref:JmjC domain-containing protein n=1 Tax=Triparma laevis f. longispina TaxID=1714387 RepID=A0A9W7CLC3_9STRA|nr:hypothetical protein TrLO_g11616 [Triparma laevis f. longispina]
MCDNADDGSVSGKRKRIKGPLHEEECTEIGALPSMDALPVDLGLDWVGEEARSLLTSAYTDHCDHCVGAPPLTPDHDKSLKAREATFAGVQAGEGGSNDVYALGSLLVCRSFCFREEWRKCLRAVDLALIRAGPVVWGKFFRPFEALASSKLASVEVEGGSGGGKEDRATGKKAQQKAQQKAQPAFFGGGRAIPVVEDLTPEAFKAEHLTKAPVVMRVKDVNLTQDILRKRGAERLVPVETCNVADKKRSYLTDSWDREVMSLEQYYEDYVEKDSCEGRSGYLAQWPLLEQISFPVPDVEEFCIQSGVDDAAPEGCEKEERSLKSVWVGSNTISPLHHDPYENWIVQCWGRKYFRLYDFKDSDCVYPMEGKRCNTSSVEDPLEPDLKKHGLMEGVEYWEFVLEEGDALYIPRHWWHYVRGVGGGGSVSFWWGARMAAMKKGGGEWMSIY